MDESGRLKECEQNTAVGDRDGRKVCGVRCVEVRVVVRSKSRMGGAKAKNEIENGNGNGNGNGTGNVTGS